MKDHDSPAVMEVIERNRRICEEWIADPDPARQAEGLLMRRLTPALHEAIREVVTHGQPMRRRDVSAAMASALAHVAITMALQLIGPGRPLPHATAMLLELTAALAIPSADAQVRRGDMILVRQKRGPDGNLVDDDPLGDFLNTAPKGNRT